MQVLYKKSALMRDSLSRGS